MVDLKIIRLAKRRMLITAKPKDKTKVIVPVVRKPKMALPASHRKPK